MNQSTEDLLTGAKQIVEHLKRSGLHWLPKSNDHWATAWSTSDSDFNASLPFRPSEMPADASVHAPVFTAARTPELIPEASVVRAAELGSVPSASLGSTDPRNVPSQVQLPAGLAPSSTLAIAGESWVGNSLPLQERSAIFHSLQSQVIACRKCEELACSRKQTVFGVGSLEAKVAFFGEAPGADEDRQGEPFVGAAGQLLNKIIAATKLKREEVYILNSLKCRPPGNRTPVDQEIANCRPFFESQLDVIQPEFIVCLGAVAARAVLQSNDSVGRLRGRFHRYRKARVLVTYHPAYLLRNESAKKLVWDDMQLLMKAIGISP
jgi:uracil-DNA glycosylase